MVMPSFAAVDSPVDDPVAGLNPDEEWSSAVSDECFGVLSFDVVFVAVLCFGVAASALRPSPVCNRPDTTDRATTAATTAATIVMSLLMASIRGRGGTAGRPCPRW